MIPFSVFNDQIKALQAYIDGRQTDNGNALCDAYINFLSSVMGDSGGLISDWILVFDFGRNNRMTVQKLYDTLRA